MPRFISPGLLRALVLGSLGLGNQACSTSDDETNDQLDGGNTGGQNDGTGGQTSSTGGRTSSTGGQTSSTGGQTSSTGGRTGSGGGTDVDAGGNAGSGGEAAWDDGGTRSSKGCTSPAPVVTSVETGIYRCAEGYVHRLQAHECQNHLPRAEEVTLPSVQFPVTKDECSHDSDCAGPDGYCKLIDSSEFQCGNAPRNYQRVCAHACRVDADCGSSAVCVCGPILSTCVELDAAAGCRTDADCQDGLCLSNANAGPFGPSNFACQLPGDQCDSRTDCQDREYCAMAPGGRTCMATPACGRPFLVAQTPRLAALVRSDAWLDPHDVIALEVSENPELARLCAEHWTEIALMEHASIAAFARFTLQLLALGAPADLVRDSTRAQADETRHALLAFELAAAYGGAKLGPAPLDLRGALDDLSVEQILRTTIAEGCVGETRAALEAAEAARVATLPALKTALEEIARDESAHATLAWRVVGWILAQRPELGAVAEEESARTRGAPWQKGLSPFTALAGAHGILEQAALVRVHEAAAREVIAPCARALLGAVAALA